MKNEQTEWEQKAQINEKFGDWTVIGLPFPQTRKIDGATEWFVPCQCKCGTYRPVRISQLRNRHSSSCGTCKGAGADSRRLYNVYRGMKMRCENPVHKNYYLYGGRGIRIDQEWETFPAFKKWAIANGHEPHLQLDRIDNDGNYGPDNCRWVTSGQNNRNRRGNHLLHAFGETRCLMDWVKDPICKISYSGLRHRLQEGWDEERAITEPPLEGAERRWSGYRLMITAWGETKSRTDWEKDPRCKVGKGQITRRMDSYGWSAERAISTPPTPRKDRLKLR